MKTTKELKEVFNNLQKGYTYQRDWHYITLSPCSNYIRWQNYGSSANKNLISELYWIIKAIFNTTPKNFIKEFELT